MYAQGGSNTAATIAAARQADDVCLIDVGIEPSDLPVRVGSFAAHGVVAFTSGLHPTSVRSDWRAQIDILGAQLRDDGKEIVAIGEMGLDFYHSTEFANDQVDALHAQFALARDHRKPVILHNRSSEAAMLEHLREFGGSGVMHCFSQDADYCRRCLDLGMHVSFGGNVTYRKSQEIRDAARLVPDERLLVETDAPFLSPQAVRGKSNHSGFLRYTIEFLADLRGTSPQELARVTGRNARSLFGLR